MPRIKISPGREDTQLHQHRLIRLLHAVCLAATVTLLTSTLLIPTDAPPQQETGVVLNMLWMVLLVVWALTTTLDRRSEIRIGWTTMALLLLIGIHLLSLMVMIGTGQGSGRPAWNILWRWVSFGTAFFLVRQVASTSLHCRAICAVMIAVAAGVSTVGLYQGFYSYPQQQERYFNSSPAEKQRTRESAGLANPYAGSTETKHFEDRLYSHEPRVTFALANSLAGWLAPWMTLAVAVALAHFHLPTQHRQTMVTAVTVAAVIGFCLLLTKSRTAWLAVVVGMAVLWIHFGCARWRMNWKPPVLSLVALIVMAWIGAFFGGLDREIASQASKSLRYRLEYWQATSGMIWDHPWFGCGPGNFKTNYTLYKLPQASETVADPHNLLLEVWSTAGTPALLALLAVLGCFVVQMLRGKHGTAAPGSKASDAKKLTDGSPVTHPVHLGAAVGIFVAIPSGIVAGCPPGWDVIGIGVPVAAVCLWLLQDWVKRGNLSLTMLVIPFLVLLLNLMAAGGISFAGIALTFWLLVALSLNLAELNKPRIRLRRTAAAGLLVFAVVLAGTCQQTSLIPVVRGGELLYAGFVAQKMGKLNVAEAKFKEATLADTYLAEPWLRLAEVSLGKAQSRVVRRKEDFRQLKEYVNEYLRRSPQSHFAYDDAGRLYLAAYRLDHEREHLRSAIVYFQEAVRRYPNSNRAHAQLALAYDLAGQRRAAAQEAEWALELDELNPHQELKLARQRLYDGLAEASRIDPEQFMRQLRKSKE